MARFQLQDDGEKTAGLYALLKRRGFFWPSFEIYGGVAGFYDLGPLGTQLRNNIEEVWRELFVLSEDFSEIDCPSITPEVVFRYSGHLEKFTDHLSRCASCGSPWRADHLLEGIIENPDTLSQDEIEVALTGSKIKCPQCGGELGPPEEFNLMFSTGIGPGGDKKAYLRPETAQNIFLDFSLLLRYNRGRIPFGVIQIGKGFRNEISPRQGMIRLREFHMAEGEFFHDPEEKGYPRFDKYRNWEANLIVNEDPKNTKRTTLGEAVANGIIGSEVLAHFMGVTLDFILRVGIPENEVRFRQHLKSEMAHYARDCWDLEVNTSFGWIEMVGIADRSAYDLTQHSHGSGNDLKAQRKFYEPLIRNVKRVRADMSSVGPLFKGKAGEVIEILESLDPDMAGDLVDRKKPIPIEIQGEKFDVPYTAVSVIETKERVHTEDFVPNVVEPSFGIDRIMTAVLEHAYDEAASSPMTDGEGSDGPYRVLRLEDRIAPIKCGVFPLLNKDGLPEIAEDIMERMRETGIRSYYDSSGSIGRRYARMDEIGTPYCITVDHDTREDDKVTIRDRDTGKQIRIPRNASGMVIESMVSGQREFESFL
ncbi:MAG: glycine--tRNA ligase [Thermoplasmatota archaeon]